MAKDTQGNNIEAVDVQVTGFAAVNFAATAAPTEAQLTGDSLPTGYEYIGLFLADGGYAEDTDAGELTEFFQQGYTLRTGDASITGKLTPAEDNDTVWKLTGIDTTAWVRSDIAYQGTFGLIISTQFKNGNIVTRGGLATVTDVAPAAESRGGISSVEISFKWQYQTDFNGYYRVKRSQVTRGKSASTGGK